MVDQIGRIVVWLLVAEAGLLTLAVAAYLAIAFIRGRDVAAQVASLRSEVAELDGLVARSLKKLSPGRPQKHIPAETDDEPLSPADVPQTIRRASPQDDRAARLQAIRNGMGLRR